VDDFNVTILHMTYIPAFCRFFFKMILTFEILKNPEGDLF
jgi:hypothetical protein